MTQPTGPRWALTFAASKPDDEVDLRSLPHEHLEVTADSMLSAMKLCKKHIYEKYGDAARFRIFLAEPLGMDVVA